jgi:hypothetical protein
MIAHESITLAARWSLAKRELELEPGNIVMLLPDLAKWTIDKGHTVRCIGVKGIGKDVAVRVVRL